MNSVGKILHSSELRNLRRVNKGFGERTGVGVIVRGRGRGE